MASPKRAIRETQALSWLDRIVEANRRTESPSRYWWWAALSAVSAVTRRNVLLRRGTFSLYPNIYVAIVSRDSGVRKGPPISLARKLVKRVNCTKVVEGRSSFQAMISELAKQVTLKDGGVLSKAHGILISEEFDTMFVKDPDALTILTTLYNTHELDEWKNTLKGSGTEVLKEPCISLLLASNEKLWTSSVKAKDTEGGFLARTIIAYEAETTVINDLIDPDPDMISEEKLPFFVDELREISKITGEFEWTKEGKEIYRPWYYDIRTTKFDDKTGSINRLGDQVLKVAMLLNLVNERDLKLHGGNIELAIAKCEECLKGVRILSHSTGREISSGDLSATHLEVLKILFGSKDGAEMSRKKLLDRLWPNVDANTLDRAMDTLKEQEAVEIIGPPRKPIYRITSEGVKLFSRFVREIKEGS